LIQSATFRKLVVPMDLERTKIDIFWPILV